MCILGVTAKKDTSLVTWLTQINTHGELILSIMRRVTTKIRGAHERTLRMLHRSLLESNVMYGSHYLRFSKKRVTLPEVLDRKERRIIAALPAYTKLQEVKATSQINRLFDIVVKRRKSQRVLASEHARRQNTP